MRRLRAQTVWTLPVIVVSSVMSVALTCFVLTRCNARAMSQDSKMVIAIEDEKHFSQSPHAVIKLASYIVTDE